MSETTAIITAAILGAIETLTLFVLSFLWAEMKRDKDELKSEILRLRDKVHELKPLNETMENFIRVMQEGRFKP